MTSGGSLDWLISVDDHTNLNIPAGGDYHERGVMDIPVVFDS